MTTTPFRRAPVAAAMAAMSIALAPGFAHGAGFALQEQNASGLGHAYAGGAAAAEDVSTIFYNPAGLVRLQSMQFVVAANAICPSTKFHDSGSSNRHSASRSAARAGMPEAAPASPICTSACRLPTSGRSVSASMCRLD